MELRRALLLFAVVLGVAAIVTSFSRPAERSEENASDPPQAQPEPTPANPRRAETEPAVIIFSGTDKPRRLRLPANRVAAVTVEVARPGQVELPGLGLTAAAAPLTPARFDVLERRAGRYKVRFIPASGGEARTVGTLRIVE